MNRIKRPCALLLAIVLILGVLLQPVIGGAFAEEMEQTEQTAELATEQTEQTVELAATQIAEPVEEPVEESTEKPTEEPVEEPTEEPTEEPVEEPVEEPTVGPAEGPVEAPPTRSFYEWLMCCDSLTALDALMGAEENGAALEALTQEELAQLLARVEELYAGIAEPTDEDALLKEALLKKLNEQITVVCPECGEADGAHAEGCSLAEPASFPWTELTDAEFAAWLMDEANAETVKAILGGGSEGGENGGESGESSEEYASLNARIDTILSGEDEALAQQVQEYLTALMGLDEPETQAKDEYIYFDLAAGDVIITDSYYVGHVFAQGSGASQYLRADHKPENKYYIYQSPTTDVTVAEKITGYATWDDFLKKQNCRLPTYSRVQYGGDSWTNYITNNAAVKEVSENWTGAATNAGRTPTDYHISISTTADVTIDNIWSSYHDSSTSRSSGGIGAHLGYNTGVKIQLRLKGDNRVGNVHYYAREGTQNQIIFSNGDDASNPGSITVGDLPGGSFNANHWCSAIGGNDDYGDPSDGIVIDSGVIWAGTTPEDNCTAIGGGGNEYGRVTITGGRVTAVSSSTGTAIGGGIGFGSQGGNADVTISDGEIYAYNLGIVKGAHPLDSFTDDFVPAAAIGGGSSKNSNSKAANVTITGGTVYAQSLGGAAIGGGGSGTSSGGTATVTISGGTVIAKSIAGEYRNTSGAKITDVPVGAGIGGGTGKTAGGSVTLHVSETDPVNYPTILRTGSIGGGKTTDGSNAVGRAHVKIAGGDIKGQVVMAGTSSDPNEYCTFEMSGGKIHETNVMEGNAVSIVDDPNPRAKIEYLHKDGGAVWMQDENGVATISGGTIEGCTANLGGAIYMEGGKFAMSDGTIRNNTAKATFNTDGTLAETGRGGAINMAGGEAEITGGTIEGCKATLGGAVYMASHPDSGSADGGTLTMSGGTVSGNTAAAIFNPDGTLAETGRGGAINMMGGTVTISGDSAIEDCTANLGGAVYMAAGTGSGHGGTLTMSGGTASRNTATAILNPDGTTVATTGRGGAINMMGGEVSISGNSVIEDCTANLGGAVYMAGGADGGHGGTFTMTDGTIQRNTAAAPTDSTGKVLGTGRGGGINMIGGEVFIEGGTIKDCTANLGGGVYMANAESSTNGEVYMAGREDRAQGGTFTMNEGTISGNTATGTLAENTGRGGGACVYGGNVRLNNGSINGNTAQTRGGGIYVVNGDVHVEGGSISANKAGYRGGGVFLEEGLFTMNGGEITLNEAGYRGGGLFLTKKPNLNGGTISFNKALGGIPSPYNPAVTLEGSGGGVCIKGDRLELKRDELTGATVEIFGNEATNGGGVAVLNGAFILDGGNVGMEGKEPNIATKSGGGVFVDNDEDTGTGIGDGSKAEVTVISGNIWYNETEPGGNGGGVYLAEGDFTILGDGDKYASICYNIAREDPDPNIPSNSPAKSGKGGGVYLAADAGEFLLDGEHASINNNTAFRGGGSFLYKDPTLNAGSIAHNTATLNGGGLFISDCEVTLNAAEAVTITENTAQNGGGIFINKLAPDSPIVAGLSMTAGMAGSVTITGNTATDGGGGVCVNNGFFDMESDKVIITDNHAASGGGVALHQGNFTMTAGSIGVEGGANTATNGGGVYVNHGKIKMKGGVVQYNEAENGGGAYVTGGVGEGGGWLIIENGSFINNTATEYGGGGYAAGDFYMLNGLVDGNSAKDGGGLYVDQGNATIVYGTITHNRASEDGGGICITSTSATDPIKMVMLSGSLSYNQAELYGGGLAVEGNSTQPITVEIGCLLDHNVNNEKQTPTLPIAYGDEGKYKDYRTIDGTTYEVQHESCPEVEYNQAGEIGGAIFVNSASAALSFFCAEEANNTTLNPDAADIEVDGGRVIIGDPTYHNYLYDAEHEQQGTPWGYVSMEDPAKVDAGQVDLYGIIINPIFKEDIRVDIQDTANNHFIDHRLSTNDYRHRIHYYENFEDKGLYRAFQYNEDVKKITVQSALFSEPGYSIRGWSTKPVYDADDPTCHYYPVGKEIDFTKDVPGMGEFVIDCEFCKHHSPPNLLVLYAIWEVNGYKVVFDPNVPQGETFTGNMDAESMTLTYGQKKNLPENKYKYPGYLFKGWNLQADGSGDTTYADKAEVSNLTDKDGATVTLYAQWELCDHDTKGVRTYTAEGATLTRACSCGGQTLTATLSAEDTVYNGKTHPAKLTFNKEADWGTAKPEIEYERKWLSDDGISHAAGTSPELSSDGKPFHAGEYTAFIKGANGANEVKATVTYTIAKAEQEPPEKPTYNLSADKQHVLIDMLAKDSYSFNDEAGTSHTAKAEYSLTYYDALSVTWNKFAADADPTVTKLDLTMDTAYTSYIVQARYAELDDYKPSEIKKADTVYFFAGNVQVIIKCDDGIDCEEVTADGNDPAANGLSLKLKTDSKYYLVSGEYDVTAKLELKNGTTPTSQPTVTQKANTDNEYSITSIQTESVLTITIGKARKKPEITAQVAPRQVFSTFTGTASTSISMDSAFTAAFGVKNFDPVRTVDSVEHGAYTDLKLTFANNASAPQTLPEDTTIILVDRSNNGKTYWHYRTASGVSSVSLKDFKKMGDSGTAYTVPTPTTENGYVDLSYQFIVDFSQSGAGYSGSSPLTMTLEATVKGAATEAPEVKPAVAVTVADSSFAFTDEGGTGLTNSFKCSFNAGAAASKWENRASALILTPDSGTVLPPDAQIKAEVVNGGTTYLYKSGNSFIAPLSLLEAEATVNLTLQSALFPQGVATDYPFTVEWQISPSKAGKAPLAGDPKGSKTNVIFTSSVDKAPSMKITSENRILESGQDLELTVKTKNIEDYTVSAALLHKLNGTYSETGWRHDDISLSGDDSLIESFGAQALDSYCLMFTVKEKDSISVVMEVPYYFVIKGAS